MISSDAEPVYDPEFVASILEAAAKPPEKTFNNAAEMLAYLNGLEND